MMKRKAFVQGMGALLGAVVFGPALTACGGGGSDSSQAQEFCDQLAAGTDPFEIFQSMRDDFGDQTEWAAAAKDWAKSTCPDQLASNEVLRNIISNTGGDPDS